MKSSLNRMSLSLALAALPFLSGCESDSAQAANTTLPPSAVATSSSVAAEDAVDQDVEPIQSPDAVPIEQTLPANVPPNSPLASVIKLAQAGMNESVILNYITNSAAPFNLTSDQMIYLRDLGLTDAAINAMIQRDQAFAAGQPPTTTEIATAPLTPPADTVETVPADSTYTYFYDSLAPYGSWTFVSDYGWCWQPTAVIINPGWQPYCDSGHWVYTDCGWYWASDYSWGWAPFHYGRWFHHPSRGWCWAPGHQWGPAWVSWRYNNDYCGWAPLPPAAHFRPGIGLTFHGRHVDANFSFGLGVDFFTFVPTARFTDRHPGHFRPGRDHETRIYNNTTVINNIVVGNNNTIINHGIGRDRIEHAVHRNIRPIHVEEHRERVVRDERHERFNRSENTLVVNRPPLHDHAPNSIGERRREREIHNNPSPIIHSAANQGNNPPDNRRNASDANQRGRHDNSPVINAPANQTRQRDTANERNARGTAEVHTSPNPRRNSDNTPSAENAVRPSVNRPTPWTPARPNPAAVQNPPPRVVTPATPAHTPQTAVQNPRSAPEINNRRNATRPEPNNQRPVITTPTPAPRVQTPTANVPVHGERRIEASRQEPNPRYTSPRIESQAPPPHVEQRVQPTFPRRVEPAVNNPAPAPRRSEAQPARETPSPRSGGNRSDGGDRGSNRRDR